MLELRGIIQYYDQGHKHVDVVVRGDHTDIYETHRIGVDIPVNRGTIEAALAKLQGKGPGEVKWPHHIRAEDITELSHG